MTRFVQSPRNHWPQTLKFIRHGESEYNVLREKYPPDVVAKIVASENGRAELDEVFKKLPSDPATPLTIAGQKQATNTGQGLRAVGWLPERLYVSPYRRTRETAIFLLCALTEGSDVRIVSPWGPDERDMIRSYSGYALPPLPRHVAFDSPEHEALLTRRDRPFIEVMEDSRVREREFGVGTMRPLREARMAALDNLQREYISRYEVHFARPESGESLEDVKDRVRDFIGHLTRKPRGRHIGVVTHCHTIMCVRAVLEKRLFRIPEVLMHIDNVDWVRNCGVTTYRLAAPEKLELERYNEVFYGSGPR